MTVAVIGGGHNSLVCATLLARAGRRVVLLEARDRLGGLAAGEEFWAGYRTTGLLHDAGGFRPRVAAALKLEELGLRLRAAAPAVLAAEAEGPGILVHADPARTAAGLRDRSAADADAYPAYRAFLARVGRLISRLLDREAPDITADRQSLWEIGRTAVALRLLGRNDMLELMRAAPMPVADWLDERFESGPLKAALALPALLGSFPGPRAPGTTANLLVSACGSGPGVVGGSAALVSALEQACRRAEVQVLTGSAVERVRVEDGRVAGVVLAGGDAVDAEVVVSGVDPKRTFLGLCSPRDLPPSLHREASVYRMRGTVAKVHLALSGPLEVPGRTGEPLESLRVAEHLDAVERASDPAKYGEVPETPVLDVRVPTVETPDLAPPGHHVVSIIAQFVPHAPRGGWTPERRDALGDAVVRRLARVAPSVTERIVGREVLTPADIEARYGTSGGHVLHGEVALDQLVLRPFASALRHRTPVAGLYLCGGGTHPGGGVTGGPGALAAAAVLADGS